MSSTMSQTVSEPVASSPIFTRLRGDGTMSVPETVPQRLALTFTYLPKLSREQCGHLRHFHNVLSQLDGDWAFMGAQETGQEWDTAYRYSLATMAYAAGAAHYHRLPAMRSMFKDLMGKAIHKMLCREVWGYWYLTSQSGIRVDEDLKELRKPWADPVCKENIMYSGHLLLMVSLYSMLFNDRTFDQEGSIAFHWSPMFWGMGPEVYTYTRNTLQETILKQMEREKWMGVCCEPNMIFIVCNQFPIIATRYNDVINGTNIVHDLLTQYRAAWAKKGMVSANGLFRAWYAPRRDKVVVSEEIGHTAWAMAFMPWNYEQVKAMHPSTGVGFLQHMADRINIHPPVVARAIKDIIAAEGGDHDSSSVVTRARQMTNGQKPSKKPFLSPTFGYVAQWLSEIAGPTELEALLRHADRYLNPSWSKGGLYYARNDTAWDQEGNYTFVEPYTGNVGIGYARLNVHNGQKKMWDQPWTAEEVDNRPWIDDVALEQDIDMLRGLWDEEQQAMVATFRTWNGRRVAVNPVIKVLPPGMYGVYINGELQKTATIQSRSEQLLVQLEVEGEEVDLVVLLLEASGTLQRDVLVKKL